MLLRYITKQVTLAIYTKRATPSRYIRNKHASVLGISRSSFEFDKNDRFQYEIDAKRVYDRKILRLLARRGFRRTTPNRNRHSHCLLNDIRINSGISFTTGVTDDKLNVFWKLSRNNLHETWYKVCNDTLTHPRAFEVR